MLKTAAIIFGAVFILFGILGFVPAVAPNGMLFGMFRVNDADNIFHLLTGVVAVAAGFVGTQASKLFFEVCGVVYALIAFLGFAVGHGTLIGFLANNLADAWLHVLMAVIALFFGFAYLEQHRAAEGPRIGR